MFDSVTKFLIENFSSDYATWLLGKPIVLTKLEPSELSLEPIRADAIIFLEGEDIILHIESQTSPSQEIFFRLLDYRVRLYRRSPQKIVKQVVIYLTPTQSPLVYQTNFEVPGTRHEFEVIRLWEQPAETFFDSPGLLPLAVLGKTNDREQTLRQVAKVVEQMSDSKQQNSIGAVAAILAGLTLDKEIIHRILRRDIMKESVIYQDILEEGIQKGLQKGIQEGLQKGIQLVALNLLSMGISTEQVATATGLPIEQVENLLTQKN